MTIRSVPIAMPTSRFGVLCGNSDPRFGQSSHRICFCLWPASWSGIVRLAVLFPWKSFEGAASFYIAVVLLMLLPMTIVSGLAWLPVMLAARSRGFEGKLVRDGACHWAERLRLSSLPIAALIGEQDRPMMMLANALMAAAGERERIVVRIFHRKAAG